MKQKYLMVLSYLLLAIVSHAQQKTISKAKSFKFGKVSLSEFNTRAEGADSAASAIALFDVGRGFFELNPKTNNFVYVFERHTRYKIIDKNGYDYANMELQFYKQNNGESKLNNMVASTYNLEDGKIVVSNLNKDAKFSEKQDKNYTLKKFALPNVKEGSIVEYKYQITSDFIYTLGPWYFQRSIPTLYSEFDLTIPEYYKYKPNAGGYVFLNPKHEIVNQTFLLDGDILNTNSIRMQYIAENVPGLKRESFVTTMDDYISKIGFELSSITIPGQVYREFNTSWNKVVKGLKEDENFGSFLNKRSYCKTILKEILKTETNPDTMATLILDYVKSHIKWNESYRLYASETNPKAVFDKKAGSSADINLSLLALLTESNLKASPVLLSTRLNGTHPGIPIITDFNNVVVRVDFGDKAILLDATNKDHVPQLIGFQNLNHQGLNLNLEAENAEWISLEEKRLSRKNISLALSLDKENKLSGRMFLSTSNYEALERRDRYRSATNETDFLKDYKSGKPGLGISNYKIENLDNLNEPLMETMDVMLENYVEEAGDLTYFTPLLFEQTKENPFKLEERNFPVDFGFPSEENYRITVNFPKEYKLEKGPKNEMLTLPENAATFSFMFASEEGKLMIHSKITIHKALFTPEEYHHLKELFKNIVRKQAEQIVIKKG